jgi:small ligand-binding sensory domain FIST
MVHGDPRNPFIAELIERVANRTETGFLVGGLTSSRGSHYQVADQTMEGGLSGVMFAPEVAVTTRLTQGVSPLGPCHIITQSQRNVILSLDHRPPLDVLKEDIGEVLSRKLEQLGGYIFVGLPTQDSDADDYLVRQLVGIDPESKVIAIGDNVEMGQPLMFCRRDSVSAVKDMQRMLDAIRTGLPGEPRGAVYYSCLGRGANLFGPNSEELKMIQPQLGQYSTRGLLRQRGNMSQPPLWLDGCVNSVHLNLAVATSRHRARTSNMHLGAFLLHKMSPRNPPCFGPL